MGRKERIERAKKGRQQHKGENKSRKKNITLVSGEEKNMKETGRQTKGKKQTIL